MTNVTTDTARENSGALKNNFDKDKVQSEINLQMDVTKNFDANRQEVKAEINKKIDDTKKENQAVLDKEKQGQFLTSDDKDQLKAYHEQVEKYQLLGVLVDSISTGLSAPTSSGLGIATAALSPKVSYEIGQYFKGLASNNVDGTLTTGQEAAHILAHTVLGAAVAATGGNDALTAGLSAGGAEAAAPILSSFLFNKKPQDLTADEKSTISAITGLVASGVGAATGDVSSRVQRGQVAQNAVENNALITESADGKNRYYTKEDNKFNLLQYLVATGQLTLDQVPDSIFEEMADRGYASLEDGSKAPSNSSEVEKYRQNFVDGIKDEQIISEQKFLELMNKNPEVWGEVKDALETKQFWEGIKEPIFQYVMPGLQLVGGGAQIVGAGAIDVVGCATVVACGVAVGGSSLLIVNGLDDIRTGWNNFGALPEGQTASSTLTSLGISENTASWIKLGTAIGSIGAEATVINKGFATSTVGNIANTADNIPQRGVLGANQGKGQADEILNGGSGQAIAGHGYYEFGTGDLIVPNGTSVITSPYGVKISDSTGRFLENVDTTGFASVDSANRLEMAKRWLNQEGITGLRADRVLEEVNNLKIIQSGNEMPNYTISPPTGLKIHENSTTVEYKTPLDQILKPEAGCIALGTCTEVKR